jgi:hypothetical protein
VGCASFEEYAGVSRRHSRVSDFLVLKTYPEKEKFSCLPIYHIQKIELKIF